MAEASRGSSVPGSNLHLVLQGFQPVHDFHPQVIRPLEVPAAEAQTQYWMANRPIPAAVDGKALEQRFVALEKLLASVQEQALAEAPRARQEVVFAPVQQPPDIGCLIDVVAVIFANLAEGLNADGQSAPGHGCNLSHQFKAGRFFAVPPQNTA